MSSLVSAYPCPDTVEADINFLIAPVNLIDVLDFACAFRAESGNKHCNACTNVRRHHVSGVQGMEFA